MLERENEDLPLPPSQSLTDTEYSWVARVRFSGKNEATAYTGNHTFSIGKQASFTQTAHPTAVDYLLGALGGDLLTGLQAIALRRGVSIDEMEARVSGRMNNPLVFLGVIGEQGHPGLEAITGTLYVSADVSEAVLQDLWRVTISRSPLVNTLQRCVVLSLSLQQIL
ncbi:MAG TPA: OsmC family protein [Ktedonobacteraceae bacterium]|nr:OsmC family protein [Ktedonobacteraceae bacterium]